VPPGEGLVFRTGTPALRGRHPEALPFGVRAWRVLLQPGKIRNLTVRALRSSTIWVCGLSELRGMPLPLLGLTEHGVTILIAYISSITIYELRASTVFAVFTVF
jgi:hypothetical protein